MARSKTLRGVLLAVLAVPLLVGCASLNAYRDTADRVEGRHAIIENYGTRPVDPAEVDALIEDVAGILGVTLDRARPKARIIVTTPGRIAALYGGAVAFPGHLTALALYFPGASLVLVPYADREILGHELAHYVTDHYLKSTRRADWEAIAQGVERQLARVAARRPETGPVVVAEAGGSLAARP